MSFADLLVDGSVFDEGHGVEGAAFTAKLALEVGADDFPLPC